MVIQRRPPSEYERARDRVAVVLRAMYGDKHVDDFIFLDSNLSYHQHVAQAVIRELMAEAEAQKQLPAGGSNAQEKP